MRINKYDAKLEKQPASNERGFGLVEVLIALGLSTLIALSIAQLVTSTSNQTAKLEKKFDLLQHRQGVASALKEKSICECNLKGKTFPLIQPRTELTAEKDRYFELSRLSFYNDDCSTKYSDVISPRESVQPGVTYDTFRFFDARNIGKNRNLLKAKIVYSGDQLVEQEYPVASYSVTTENAGSGAIKITSCEEVVIDPDAIVPGNCFRLRCTSLSGNTQTIDAEVVDNGVIVARSPSRQSAWVFKYVNGVRTEHNCWSDKAYSANRSLTRQRNVSLCRQYGARAKGMRSGYTSFSYGAANPFRSCRHLKC